MAKYIVTHGIRIAKDFIPETFGRLTTVGLKNGWSLADALTTRKHTKPK